MPGICTVNGLNVFEGEINIPRIGVWTALFSMDTLTQIAVDAPARLVNVDGSSATPNADMSPEQLTKLLSGLTTSINSALIEFGSQVFKGTFDRGGPSDSGRSRVRIVGGYNGLGSLLDPKGYGSVPIRIPLNDCIGDAGEKLSPSSDPGILNFQLPTWSRMQVSAGAAIRSLLFTLPRSPSWRMLLDGTVWVGYESWQLTKLSKFNLIATEPERGRIVIAHLDPTIFPGESITYDLPNGKTVTQKISYVKHMISPERIRTLLYFE